VVGSLGTKGKECVKQTKNVSDESLIGHLETVCKALQHENGNSLIPLLPEFPSFSLLNDDSYSRDEFKLMTLTPSNFLLFQRFFPASSF
jgi:hypothetical protein